MVGITELAEATKKAFVGGPIISANCATSNATSGGGGDEVEFGSLKFYGLCGIGGILSCGITHTAIVPLDLVKCRIQVDPAKYKGIIGGFKVSVQEEGVRGLAKGWAPTAIGYSLQGLGKFGLYEVFKNVYAGMIGEELAYSYRTGLYLVSSASAEFFADMLLAPMEATKVRIQTAPGAPPTLRGCAPFIYQTEGLMGFYKGLPPLWLRQIPYTMMKFACFERTVELLYKYVVPKPRAECTKPEQLVVTFVAGYIAGVFCAVVSHPADTLVSQLNKDAKSSAVGILKKLGPLGVWGGLVPRIIMIGTLTALQWFIYDFVKVSLNIPRPPPPEMPESLKKKLEAAGKLQ
uniref:Phosphate carrier protein, mitochondrial n=1 Tax=Globodera rostochiensis TaxID=31243 RepID=A0A914IBZ4_GLORO